MNLVQGMKLCTALEPTRGEAAVQGEGIDLTNAHMVFVVIQHDQGAADRATYTLQQDDGTDGNWEALVNTVPLWINNDTDANDVLVRQTNAVSYQVSADVNPKMIVFQVDPSKLDDENGTSGNPNVALRIAKDATGDAGDTLNAIYIVAPTRYSGATVPEIRL